MPAAAPKPTPPREPLIMYVDGANLYHGLHRKFGRRFLWLDLVELAHRLRPRSRLVQVKYFTTPVIDEPDAQSRQARYGAALKAKNGSRILLVNGRYQTKTISCRTCNAEWQRREEKETDVSIATHLVADAALRHMRAALILSGDSDLAPAVRMAQQINPNLFIAAAFPPLRGSKELRTLMPASFVVGESAIRQSQLPKSFTIEGVRHTCPEYWA